MYAYGSSTPSQRRESFTSPSDELRIGLTFPRSDGGPGLTRFAPALSRESVRRFIPDPLVRDRALHEFARRGFTLTQQGRLSASFRGSRALFESTFRTELASVNLDPSSDYAFHTFYYPPEGARWDPPAELTSVIDDAYIQWPHIYMARAARAAGRGGKKAKGKSRAQGKTGPALKPPRVPYYHLEVPRDVAKRLGADRVHAQGTTGKGVRVVMVDSGFAHRAHPFFARGAYRSSVDLAPGATDDKTDPNGHGTGESANVFSVAPEATFIGVKVDNDRDPRLGASLLEGFQTALAHRPQIITISMGYDLREAGKGQLSELPNSLAALEAEVQAAVADGVIVVFSAGNGHFSFPGMMPDVISAGGVFVPKSGSPTASDYASAFTSKIYSGRHVPDLSGLVGMQPHAAYLMLPIPPGCEIDGDCANPADGEGDATGPADGWGVFSGTSAAAPQLAGVCALLLEKDPRLTPSDVKAILRRTARDVRLGHANPASSDDFQTPAVAGPGDDGATGAGLVNAFAAWQQL